MELKYGALYCVNVWRELLFYREILQDSDIIFHNKIKSTPQPQARTLTKFICREKKYESTN